MFLQRNSVAGLAYLGPKPKLLVKHPRKTTIQYLHKQSNITLTNFVKGPDSVTKFLSKPQQQQTSQLTSLSTFSGTAFLVLSMARKGPSQDWNPGLQCPDLWPLCYSTHRLLCCPPNTKTLSTTQQASKMRIFHLTSDQVSPPPHHCHPDSPLSLPPKPLSSVSSTCLASTTSVWPAERPRSCFMLWCFSYCV